MKVDSEISSCETGDRRKRPQVVQNLPVFRVRYEFKRAGIVDSCDRRTSGTCGAPFEAPRRIPQASRLEIPILYWTQLPTARLQRRES